MAKDLIMRHYINLNKFPEYLKIAILNIFGYIFYFLSFIISFLIPRKKDIWIFGSWSGKRFSDNSKYLFLYVANNHKDGIRPIWISKDKNIIRKLRDNNYDAYYAYEIKGIYYNLRAKYIISDSYFNSVNFWCCGGSIKVQLRHGFHTKKIEHDAKNLPWNKPFFRLLYHFVAPWMLIKNNYIFSLSDIDADISVSAFQTKKEKIIITGYPRNDIMFNKILGYDILDKYIYNNITNIKRNDAKLFLYMPTFRDSKDKEDIDLKNIDLDKMNSYLGEINGFFLVKFHPVIKINVEKYDQWSRIIFLPSGLDIYPLLNQIDILITDYSSIYIDFLIVDKPIIFYQYDIEDYVKNDRELYFDYGEFYPGPKASTFVDLLYWINYLSKNNDDFIGERKKIRDICFKYNDGYSSRRIYDFIKKLG